MTTMIELWLDICSVWACLTGLLEKRIAKEDDTDGFIHIKTYEWLDFQWRLIVILDWFSNVRDEKLNYFLFLDSMKQS